MDDDTNLHLASDKVNEIQISEEFEAETAAEKSFYSTINSTAKTKEKNNSLSKRKTKCHSVFKKQWVKDPKYTSFLQECKTSPYLAHCSICKSDFSIGNRRTYFINRHLEQATHKRLVEAQMKEKCKNYYRRTITSYLIDFFLLKHIR